MTWPKVCIALAGIEGFGAFELIVRRNLQVERTSPETVRKISIAAVFISREQAAGESSSIEHGLSPSRPDDLLDPGARVGL